ncbi:MAG TPA: hypothetical protein VIY47_10515, partial [Ignavibacteriaceae bacterium]
MEKTSQGMTQRGGIKDIFDLYYHVFYDVFVDFILWSNKMSFKDNQVFLIMGVSEEKEEASVAVVGAETLEEAQSVFSKTFPNSVPMTWPSLAEIRLSVE